jgi:DNA end-binding protein Ku
LPEHKKKTRARAKKEEEPETETSARAFWSGTITFGLVSIPVDLVSTSASDGTSMRMLADDGTALQREYVCPTHEEAIPPEELARGYELDDGRFVIVSDEELESIAPEKSRDIALVQFVDQSSLDPTLFRRAYYLAPRGDSTRAYRLLADTLQRKRRAGIATFVMRERQYPVAIFGEDGILRAQTLRHLDEVRTPKQVGLPEVVRVSADHVKSFSKFISAHAREGVPASTLDDPSAHELRSLAEGKRKRGEDVVELSEPVETVDAAQEEPADMMSLLKRRLASR